MKEITCDKFDKNVFDAIGKQWMLVGAQADGRVNAMTASWGGVGVMWNKNVVFVFLRPQRFTKTLIDKSERFSLSFFTEEYRKMLAYMGKASGKDEDKIAAAKLTCVSGYDAPVFKQAETTLVCKKLYSQKLGAEGFYEEAIVSQCYPQKDYHEMYVAEIEKVLLSD